MKNLDMIKSRKSIRKFEKKEVEDNLIQEILECGRWAPSGLNNQPWKFHIIKEKKNLIANCTKYSYIIKNAPICIAVFLDNESTYNRTKDLQSIGACIENMLLAIHSLNLGGVWLGEILNQKEKVNEALSIDQKYELMGIIALGYPKDEEIDKVRKPRKNMDQIMI